MVHAVHVSEHARFRRPLDVLTALHVVRLVFLEKRADLDLLHDVRGHSPGVVSQLLYERVVPHQVLSDQVQHLLGLPVAQVDQRDLRVHVRDPRHYGLRGLVVRHVFLGHPGPVVHELLPQLRQFPFFPSDLRRQQVRLVLDLVYRPRDARYDVARVQVPVPLHQVLVFDARQDFVLVVFPDFLHQQLVLFDVRVQVLDLLELGAEGRFYPSEPGAILGFAHFRDVFQYLAFLRVRPSRIVYHLQPFEVVHDFVILRTISAEMTVIYGSPYLLG